MTLTENKEESKRLAQYISNRVPKQVGERNRGVKSANFYVLRGTRMPAVLVEVGFVSNREEERRLSSPSYRQKLASALADSIMAYEKEFALTEGFTKGI